MEVKPAEFARIAGVSRPSISEKIKNKTLIINAAGMLDTDNLVNARYISKHKQKAAQAAAEGYVNSGAAPPPPGGNVSPGKLLAAAPGGKPAPDDFTLCQLAGIGPRELLNMTLREIVIKFPGIQNIERYAKILKDVTMAAEKEQRMKKQDLVLIDKDFVVSRIFGFIETLTKQALEYPETAADRLIALSKAQGEAARIEIIKIMREGIGRVVAGSKDRVIAELNALKNKYENDSQNDEKFNDFKQAIIEEVLNE